MAPQRNIFLIALAGSLVLHLASVGVYVGYRTLAGAYGPAQIAVVGKTTTLPAEDFVIYPEMGDDAGTGIGSNSAPGDHPMQAQKAPEDQALLSRNPTGQRRPTQARASRKAPPGDGSGAPPSPPAQALATPAKIVAPMPTKSPATPPAKTPTPASPPANAAIPQPTASPSLKPEAVASALPLPNGLDQLLQPPAKREIPKPPAPAPQAKAAPPAPKPQMVKPTPPSPAEAPPSNGDGRPVGAPQPAGNPLPQSDSDSDPFSHLSGTVVFRDGRLDVRMGRKIKTTRPQIQIAGQIDLLALNNPTVVVEVHIDRTGKVTDVKVAHSSGSNSLDEPTRLAVYDWWFEPAKDKHGKPVPDVIFFSVEFVN